MEILMAMRHLRLDYVLAGDKEEVPGVDRTISRDRLHAHYVNFKVAKYFAIWRLVSSSLKTDSDKRVFFQYLVANGWLGQGRFFSSCRTTRSKVLSQQTGS